MNVERLIVIDKICKVHDGWKATCVAGDLNTDVWMHV